MLAVLLGPPGSGKGTQAQSIVKKLGLTHLSTGDLLRKAVSDQTKLGLDAKGYMDSGELVPDEVVIGLIQERLSEIKDVLFDGFPRNIEQAVALDKMLEGIGLSLDQVINLLASDEEVLQRLSARNREDDTIETVENRIRVYKDQTAPLVDYYQAQGKLRTVDGMGTVEEVFDRICREMES